jgi:hypothetical protein
MLFGSKKKKKKEKRREKEKQRGRIKGEQEESGKGCEFFWHNLKKISPVSILKINLNSSSCGCPQTAF